MVRRFTCLLAIAATLIPGWAVAGLEELRYTDPQGQEHNISPDSDYINAKGELSALATAGLDRKVGIKVYDADGNLVDSSKSDVIGVEDTVDVDGSTRYGVRLTGAIPDSQGEMSLESIIYSAQDEVVESNEMTFIVDRTPPSFTSEPKHTQYRRYRSKQWDVVNGRGGGPDLSIDYDWEGAAPTKAIMRMTSDANGETGTEELDVGSSGISDSISINSFPHKESWHDMELVVIDEAGNRVSHEWRARVDAAAPYEYEVVGVYDPGAPKSDRPWSNIPALKDYVRYESGVKIGQARTHLLVKLKKSAHYNWNFHGLYGQGRCCGSRHFGFTSNVKHTSGDTVYGTTNSYGITDANGERVRVYSSSIGADGARGPTKTVEIGLKDGEKPYIARPSNPYNLRFADGSVHSRGVKLGADDEWELVGFDVNLKSPLPQDAEVVLSWGPNKTIPAGETTARVRGASTTGRYPGLKICYKSGEKKCSTSRHATAHRSDRFPEINGFSYKGPLDEGVFGYQVEMYVWNSNTLPGGLSKDSIKLKQDGSTKYTFDAVQGSRSGGDYVKEYEIKDIDSGVYDVVISAEDKYGNITEEKLETREFDLDKPVIKLHKEGEEWSGGPVKRLSDIGIEVINQGSEASIESITLNGGPAGSSYDLAWRWDNDRARLEYPLMFPSMEEGEEYSITVNVKDEKKNTASKSKTFMFKPATTVVNGEDGVMIPAVEEVVYAKDGMPPIYSEPVTLGDGSKVVGVYDLVVTLRKDSDFSINLHGYEIMPGETKIIDDYSFDANDSRIVLPAYPTEKTVGEANLLVSPSIPGSDYILATINTWLPKPEATLNGDAFSKEKHTIAQALDSVEATLKAGAGDFCSYTTSKETAIEANPLFEPACFVSFEAPSTIEPVPDEAGLEGFLTGAGEQKSIKYDVFLAQQGKAEGVKVKSDVATIDVVEPDLTFDWNTDTPVTRHIQEFSRRLESTGGKECRPVLSPDDAKRSRFGGAPSCLIEWTNIPSGIITNRIVPAISGIAETKDKVVPKADVTYFDPDGNPYFLLQQEFPITVAEPDPIEMVLGETEYQDPDTGEPMYFVPRDGGDLGEAKITGSGGDITVGLTQGQEKIRDYTYMHRGGYKNPADFQYGLWLEEMALWDDTGIKVEAAYKLLPEMRTETSATAVAVPSESISADIIPTTRKVIDTNEMAATVKLDGRALTDGYDPIIHGNWEARIVRQEEDDYRALTDWKAIEDDGAMTAPFSLKGEDDSRLLGQVRLKSPYDQYSRQFLSRRAFVKVLRGGSIDGDLYANRIEGRSDLRVFLRVEIEEYGYQEALGEVTWMMSKDGGDNWSEIEQAGFTNESLRMTLPAGDYQVKAKLRNQYTGAESETPVQPIKVYDVPRIEVEGPSYAYTTQEAELSLNAELHWEEVDPSQYIVEWSDDEGETWDQSQKYTVKHQGEPEERVLVRISDDNAPENDESAYSQLSHEVRFIEPEGPRVDISGPRKLERGEPGTYSVNLRAPRRGMEIETDGEWILPNGEVIPGQQSIEYNPTEEDVEAERVDIRYAAWAPGFRGDGAYREKDYMILPWQYEWPEWDLFANSRALEAPANIRLTPRTPGWYGWLDDEQFEFLLPEGASTVYERDDRTEIRIEEPGSHVVGVRVTDARGHESVVKRTVTLDEPEDPRVEFKYSLGNDYKRAPLEVRPRIYIRGGHSLDRVDQRQLLVNGESRFKSERTESIVLDQPGEYTLTAKVFTEMGKTAEKSETIEVVENKLPVCDPEISKFYGVGVNANCSDEDGLIRDVIWTMNGEKLESSSYRYRFTDSQIEEMGGSFTLKVQARDDAGELSEPKTVNYTQ